MPQIARRLDRHEHPMRTWLKAYRSTGLTGLHHTPQAGRPATPGPRVAAQRERLFAHRPSQGGSLADGWTVALLRASLAQPQAPASDATGRRQRRAGDWVSKRCASTVPRDAPSAENNKPGWQTGARPWASGTRHGP